MKLGRIIIVRTPELTFIQCPDINFMDLFEHGANSRRTRRCSVQPVVSRPQAGATVGLEGNPTLAGRSRPANARSHFPSGSEVQCTPVFA